MLLFTRLSQNDRGRPRRKQIVMESFTYLIKQNYKFALRPVKQSSLQGARGSGLLVQYQSGCGYEHYVVTIEPIYNNVHLKDNAQLKHWWLIHNYMYLTVPG